MRILVWLTGVIVCLCACGSAFGQSRFGTILGTIQNDSGSLIPGVAVTATNVDTVTQRTAISNEAEPYQFPNMHPGAQQFRGDSERAELGK
jgi:hypothetical protein